MEPSIVLQALEKFFLSLNDYAVDKWGDVGSWVREQGMVALEFFFSEFYLNLTEDEQNRIIPAEE